MNSGAQQWTSAMKTEIEQVVAERKDDNMVHMRGITSCSDKQFAESESQLLDSQSKERKGVVFALS